MKYKKTKIISVVVCLCLLVGLLYESGVFSALGTALNVGTTDSSDLKPKTNTSAELGTAENPFTVLEVVPSHEEAQFGYFIPGCEPIDMERAKYSETALGNFRSTLSSIYDISIEKAYAFYDQIPVSSYLTVNNTTGNANYSSRTDLNYSDTWENYGQWRSEYNTEYSQKGYWVEEEGGGFDKNGGNYQYVGEGNGSYRWVASEDGTTTRKQNNGDLFAYQYIKYDHKDTFIQYAFDGEKSSTFQSQVITMTPAELEEHLDLIDTADLIYIHPGSGDYTGLAEIYKELNKNGEEVEVASGRGPTFWDKGNDLTYNEVIQITKRMASDNPAALMLDKANMFASSNAQREYNCHKLLYMVLTFKPEVFWNYFGSYLQPYTGADGTTKVEYTKGSKEGEYPPYRFWGMNESCDRWTFGGTTYSNTTNPFLFHPDTGACLIDEIRYYNIGGGGNDIFDKIMTYQGDTATLQTLLTGGYIANQSIDKNGLWTNNVTSDAFTDDNEGKSYLTNMDAVKFILSQPTYIPKLRILEVEPCDEYIYGEEGWEEYYQALFPWYHPKSSEKNWLHDTSLITVTTMPTWEFIGSTGQYDYGETDEYGNLKILTTESSDDLIAKYDLIIIGSKQNESNGSKGYNRHTNAHTGTDVDLGNLIYTSVGGTLVDGAVASSNGSTASNIDLLDVRYSGNDITLKKLLELEDFLRAGKPVVVDEGLYSNGSVDTAKVDKDSKVYDLLTWSGSGSENRFIHGSISSSKMKKLVSQNVCRIEFYEEGYPVEYGYTEENKQYSYGSGTGTAEGVIVNEIYQGKTGDNGRALLTYHFYIYGNAADTYNAYLNLDLDGDGVYSGSLKERSEVDNMNAAMGYIGTSKEYYYDTSEVAVGLKIYDKDHNYLGTTNPNSGDSFALSANTEYYATREIPSAQQGMIPWKLEVQSRSNEYLRSSAIDYTAIYNKQNQAKIMVLQMCLKTNLNSNASGFTSYTKDSIVVKSGESYQEFDTRRVLNGGVPETDTRIYNSLNNYQKQTVAKFETYLEPVQEFDVTIQFMYNTDWYSLFGTTKTSGPEYEQKLADWENFLSNYDMLVFGFQDSATFTSDTVFEEGLRDFVSQGKSMIFSHDMVYGTRLGSNPTYTPWLRAISGQRRSYYNLQSNGKYEKSYTDVKVNGTTVTNTSAYNIKNNSGKLEKVTEQVYDDVLGEDFYGEWVSEYEDNSAFACLNVLAGLGSSRVGLVDRVPQQSGKSVYGGSWVGNAETSWVKLTNNGQITTYPYHINEYIKISTSHIQYFQLDLEYIDQGDVNVWFNLTDRNDEGLKAYSKENGINLGSDSVNIYSSRDQDCRDNFFIYNVGNITYTGSGHSGNWMTMTDDEVKLFVNTMIAAYRQPESKPYAEIDNADAVATDGTSVLYLDYDGYQYETAADEDGTEDENAQPQTGEVKSGLDNRVVTINGRVMVGIEFSIHDMSSTSELTDKRCYMRLYHEGEQISEDNVIVRKLTEDENGNVIETDVPLDGKDTVSPYYHVDANDEGVPYIMYVPYEDVMDGDGISRYSIGTYATYTKSKRFVTTATTTTNVDVMLLPLFNLD